ncbi:MAG: RNA polymerase subunit sigma-70 [Planctomycetaceae bacterium]|nr:RNA polymerase subunit sigma-70 [Planctomycetaceae bacterium]
MIPEGSITRWLGPLKAGEEAAIPQLWERYFPRLVELARKKLRAGPRRMADEEDAALSAFDSFCRAAEAGRFPQLFHRDDLWHILVVITTRKAANLIRQENAQKRGAGQVRAEADLQNNGDDSGPRLAEMLARDPDPAFVAEATEQCRHLLELLPTAELRQVAVRKMEGHTNEEIAAELNRPVGTVERRLREIRRRWTQELTSE